MLFLKTLLLWSIGMSGMGAGSDNFSCSSRGINAWPTTETALPNQQFMVQGYAIDEIVAARMGKTYHAYLQSEGERVDLEVVSIHVGQKWLTQAILKPKSLLKEGVEYELTVDGLDEQQTIGRYDSKAGKYKPYRWKVVGKADDAAPKWFAPPKEHGKHYDMFGCGPALGVEFVVNADEMNDLRVLVQLRPQGGTEWTSYCIPVYKGLIDIGHGMCSGEFTLHEAKSFEAKFSLVDPAGNTTEWTESLIQFDRPSEMNE